MARLLILLSTILPMSLTYAGEPVCDWEIVRRLDHDPDAFTQGLDVVGDTIYESTGLYGQSSVRHLQLATGETLKRQPLDARYFGEGMVVVNDLIYLVTWREQTGMVLDRESLNITRTFKYRGEGWGLTFDGKSLVMSNGSSELQFLDPADGKLIDVVNVTSEHGPVAQLNELEYVDDSIYANIWQTEVIARIDPKSGKVISWLNMQGLLGPQRLPGVLNGIAALPQANRLLVTGKNWPAIFEIETKCD